MKPHPPHSGLHTGMELLRAHRRAIAGYWLIMVLLFGIIGIFVLAFSDHPTSVWIGARWAPQYFIAGLGIATAAQHLRVHVSHGVTRRHFIAGGIWSGIAVSLIFGAVMELGFVLERAIYHFGGWTQFDGTKDLVSSPQVVAASAAEFIVMYAAYYFAGWMIASGFYRFRTWTGVLLMVPAALPPLLIESMQWRSGPLFVLIDQWGVGALNTIAYLAVGTVLIAATGLAVYLMLRRVPLGVGATATR